MTELSRSLIASAREGLAPDPDVMARVRAKVAATVAAGAVVTTATSSVSASAASQAATAVPASKLLAASKLLTAWKLTAVVASALVIAGVAVVVTAQRPGDDAPVSVAAPAVGAEAPGSSIVVRTRMRIEATSSPAQHGATTHVGARKPTATIASPVGAEPSLAREVELVDGAMLALRAHAPERALAELAVYARETRGRGQLAEDAAAIDIEARCALGQDTVARIAAFEQRWPSSAQRARISDACGRR